MRTLTGITLFALTLSALPRGQGQQQAPAPAGAVSEAQALSPVIQTCVVCHGETGSGRPALSAPRIAGQSAYYLSKQLESYVNGTRRDPGMEPIARGLSPELRRAISDHYAQVAAPAESSASAFTAPWGERGRVLATQGDPTNGVQACDNCHGPEGIGQPPAIPYLAGLDDGYIRSTLIAWREGRRSNDAGRQMEVIAKAMSPDNIAAVARYYAAVPSPGPAPSNVATAGRPQLLPPDMTRVMVKGTESDTSGSEGPSPQTGGTQGPGQPGQGERGAGTTGGGTAARSTSNQADAPGAPGSVGDPDRGRALVESGIYGCTACHTIPGIRSPRGIVGPSLDGMAVRPLLAGQLRNTPDMLVSFLRNPPLLVPATGMPDVGLSAEDARHIAAYLYTLEQRRDR